MALAGAASLFIASILPTALGLFSDNAFVAKHAVSRSLAAQFEELGCFEDGEKSIMTDVVTGISDLTETSCAAICEDFPYYGLQDGSECWCGDYTSSIDRYGGSEDCDVACTGNSSTNCGGNSAMRVFTQTTTDGDAIGCFGDSSDRVFSDKLVDHSGMTPEVCYAHCNSNGALYYGTQWGQECWCGYVEGDYDRLGSATCDRPCSGDPTLFCGGSYAMTVYEIATTDGDAIGCFGDSSDRVFSDKLVDHSGMTPEVCYAHCNSNEALYYGTQWGQECWCGYVEGDYDRLGSATCDRPCSGDPTLFCGGSYAMTVYEIATTDGDAIGCFGDSSDRVFSDKLVDHSGMTPEVCYAHCNSNEALYYGTQWGQECWCGYVEGDYDRLGSATCDRPCSGDPMLFCGGSYAMTVYEIDDPTGETSSPIPSPVFSASPMPVSSPTPIMTIPDECTSTKSSIRWASGTGLNGRMYLEGGGCGTMTDLYKTRVEADGWTPKGPIYILDDDDEIMYSPTIVTGKWLLTSELFVLTGSIFYCRGTGIGGDCDELRIQSTGPTDFHEVRGHGGSLYFEDTVVTSWDTPNKRPQEEHDGGRSFLNCVSEYESSETCEGQAKNDYGECRMDIIDSEMGYLGWFDSESYGLTWKVRGFCTDKSNLEVFDTTNVYGDIKNSDIHHMYYGMYSYGHQGGVWTNNKMHDNHQYGFDPHDDSDYLTIANNEVYNNENHGIIASKRCNNVKIYGNEVYNGGEQAAGIFLHRSSDSCEVYDNNVHDMQDAGLAILESFDADIHDNTFRNVNYGIRISLGGANNMVHDNVFDECSAYGLYTYQGSDAPEASSDGRSGENSFYDNTISNTETGVKIKEADNTIITGNTFTGTSLLEFNDAESTAWSSNTFEDADPDLCYKNIASSTFTSTDTLPSLC